MDMKEPATEILHALYSQIEEICREFNEIRSEAEGIVNNNQMPDAALHLNDVLKATEEATITILDAITSIGTMIDSSNLPFDAKEEISEKVGLVYEACSFQDISGQRIKKVLQHLNSLENQLHRLSDTAHGQQVTVQKTSSSLLNGPQLSAEAPSQADVDNLFGTN